MSLNAPGSSGPAPSTKVHFKIKVARAVEKRESLNIYFFHIMSLGQKFVTFVQQKTGLLVL